MTVKVSPDIPVLDDEVQFLTVKQIAVIMKVCRATVLSYIHGRKLTAIKLGLSYRVSLADFKAFLASKKERSFNE